MKKLLLAILFCAGFGFFLGCGGGGGGGTAPASTPVSAISGVVKDGPIQNANVFIDLNFNGRHDTVSDPLTGQVAEPNDVTDTDGKFSIPYVLDSGSEYVLVAEGSAALGTVDLVDNAGAGNLEFVMFTSIETGGETGSEDFVGVTYQQDITPQTMQTYLKKVDEKLSGSLDPENTVIKKLVSDSSTDVTSLFKSHIVKTANKNIFQEKLVQIAKLVKSEQEAKETAGSTQDLGLDSASNLSFSTEPTQNLTNELAFVNKTTPVKVGDIVIASTLKEVTTTSSFKVFVTPYPNMMAIPDYAALRNSGHQVVVGADVVAKNSSGKRIAGVTDTQALNDALGAVSVGSLNQNDLSYFVYKQNSWQEISSNASLSNGRLLGVTGTFEMYPFVLVKKNTLQAAQTISVPGYSVLQNPVVAAKGKFTGTAEPGGTARLFKTHSTALEQTLDVNQLLNGKVIFRLPASFEMSQVVVLSKDLTKITTGNKTSVSIPVKEGNIVEDNNSVKVSFIESSSLRSLILSGSGLEGTGVSALIETRILYEDLPPVIQENPTLSQVNSANQVIRGNMNSFLGGTGVFQSQGVATLSWKAADLDGNTVSYEFKVDATSKLLTLSANAITNTSSPAYNRTLQWRFEKGKVSRTETLNHFGGSRSGSSKNLTVDYIQAANGALSAVISDDRTEVNASTSGFKSSLTGSYKGSAQFNHDSNYQVTSLVTSRLQQKMSQLKTNQGQTIGGTVSLAGVSNIQVSTNSAVGNLSFEGNFNLFFNSYGQIEGRVITRHPSTVQRGYDKGYFNNNTVSEAVISVTTKPAPSGSSSPVLTTGQWTGNFTDSCGEDGTILLTVTNSKSTFAANSADNQRVYGVSVEVIGTRVILRDGISLFSDATLNEEGTQISGNWSAGSCSGQLTLNKP